MVMMNELLPSAATLQYEGGASCSEVPDAAKCDLVEATHSLTGSEENCNLKSRVMDGKGLVA